MTTRHHIQPNPLDYVPVDHLQAPPLAHQKTAYTPPALRRGLTAAGWYLAIVAAGFILAVTTGII